MDSINEHKIYIMRQTIINGYQPTENFTKNDWIRSRERTDLLHYGVIDHVKSIVPNFDNKYYGKIEHKIVDPLINKTGYMSVDIVIFNKSDDSIAMLIPFKQFCCNALQNMGNYLNGYISEQFRIRMGGCDAPIVFLTMLSNNTPYFKGNGSFKKWEINPYRDLSKYSDSLHDDVHFGSITYSVEGENPSTKKEFYDNINNNLTNINTDKFDGIIRSILH